MAELGALISRAAEKSYVRLKELVEKCNSSNLSDSEKKIGIHKYITKTKQRMLRLNVLLKCLSSHDSCFTYAADSLFFMYEGLLQQTRAPIYDVPSAVEVLRTGSYECLPKCMEDVGLQRLLNDDQQRQGLKKLDVLVRSKLLEVEVPKDITEVKVSDGTVLLCVDREFKVLVTLGYRGHLLMWRILYMELFVGELDDNDCCRTTINDLIQLYSILHELCVALVMNKVVRQVQRLCKGRWKDAIRFELIDNIS
ncbi:hypothetical protein R3W88_011114 [Solanum pinnatisectum]|uniref:Mediator of RNA polymerase II transcription subunit 14 n=1 Tax=Solanum pinnatisectum TaxID=50273 RepID=A0AAV9L5A2_9SOLN|nr:hypothetical protein R3W88_011114 [Solanum pinnatisectum]